MRRSRFHLYLQILEICCEPSRKTWIVYKLNSNFREVGRMLRVLLNSGYLLENEGKYFVTKRGLNAVRYFSHAYREYPELTPQIGG